LGICGLAVYLAKRIPGVGQKLEIGQLGVPCGARRILIRRNPGGLAMMASIEAAISGFLIIAKSYGWIQAHTHQTRKGFLLGDLENWICPREIPTQDKVPNWLQCFRINFIRSGLELGFIPFNW
jgi:hypothetical protein